MTIRISILLQSDYTISICDMINLNFYDIIPLILLKNSFGAWGEMLRPNPITCISTSCIYNYCLLCIIVLQYVLALSI